MKSYSITLILLTLTGCASIHHVTPKRFQIETNIMQTFHWSEYIGEADGNAYLLRKSAPLMGKNWNSEILYTETEGLSLECLKQLQETKKQRTSNKAPATR